jgi:hypothetical protein
VRQRNAMQVVGLHCEASRAEHNLSAVIDEREERARRPSHRRRSAGAFVELILIPRPCVAIQQSALMDSTHALNVK